MNFSFCSFAFEMNQGITIPEEILIKMLRPEAREMYLARIALASRNSNDNEDEGNYPDIEAPNHNINSKSNNNGPQKCGKHGCNSPAVGKSRFCIEHKCRMCDREVAIGAKLYCLNHKCNRNGCNNPRVQNCSGTSFCTEHKCAEPRCPNSRFNNKTLYCSYCMRKH